MAWFSKVRQSKSLVPPLLLEQLAAFGKASWEAKQNSQPVHNSLYDWDNFFSQFLSAYNANLSGAIAELHQAAGADPFARYGGYRLVAEFDGACKDTLYLAMMDSALQMMYEHGLSSGHMTGYERDRWIATHGDLRTSFDRVVEVERPTVVSVPQFELGHGQSVMVARMGPGEFDNQFWVERVDGVTYRAYSMRRSDSEAVTLTRYEEESVGSFESLGAIFRGIGDYLRTPSYWVHSELVPYFPERRNL